MFGPWSFWGMFCIYFIYIFGLLFPFTAVFKLWNTKKCKFKDMKNPSTQSRFIFKIADLTKQIFCRTNIWGEGLAYICRQCRGRSWGEMATLSPCVNPLGSSSKEHLHVYTSKMDIRGSGLTERVALTHAAAEVSLFYSHFLSWQCTFPGPPHHVTMNSELTCCDVLHSALCATASTVWLMCLHALVDVNTIYTALIKPPHGARLLAHVCDNQPER